MYREACRKTMKRVAACRGGFRFSDTKVYASKHKSTVCCVGATVSCRTLSFLDLMSILPWLNSGGFGDGNRSPRDRPGNAGRHRVPPWILVQTTYISGGILRICDMWYITWRRIDANKQYWNLKYACSRYVIFCNEQQTASLWVSRYSPAGSTLISRQTKFSDATFLNPGHSEHGRMSCVGSHRVTSTKMVMDTRVIHIGNVMFSLASPYLQRNLQWHK